MAQWQWTDQDGRKVFSDRPPPADVPPARILKQPHSQPLLAVKPSAAAEDTKPAATPATPAAMPATTAASGTDKALEEKKAKAEAEEAAKVSNKEEAAA